MDFGFAAPLLGAHRPVGRSRSAGAEHAPRNPGFAPRNDGMSLNGTKLISLCRSFTRMPIDSLPSNPAYDARWSQIATTSRAPSLRTIAGANALVRLHKTDATFFYRIGRRHELTNRLKNAGDGLVVGCKLSADARFKFIQSLGELLVRSERFA